ncbi:hypothetical protein JOC77_000456 [Peribacillus deserti]|uniref:Uncharacterized protein n=1 Tax=Peribacillus deserti TaxID=673318 RepID=A0ABS2QD18_9BACI|nr:hypothetical protein [Peribacillus deserti]MBM7691051.1 hypothetical protein [Peribacillus deserti]
MYWYHNQNQNHQGNVSMPISDYYYIRQPASQDPSDVKALQASAASFIPLTKEIHQLLTAIAYKPQFARQLKEAGAQGNVTRVQNLIRSIPVGTPFRVHINPDGISVIFLSPTGKTCFGINVSLCW